jgi:hypothetical protein
MNLGLSLSLGGVRAGGGGGATQVEPSAAGVSVNTLASSPSALSATSSPAGVTVNA